MVQRETNLIVADNSGAKKVRIFSLSGGSYRKSANIGDIVICAVKAALPNGAIKKGAVVKGVIVRSKTGVHRANGTHVKFNDNAVVLVKEEKDGFTPIGTRVFGPVARELREHFMKIISLAPEVL
ncbi:MAG: 50S ribosomal protein L14 [Bacillales bacterium]|jgi:large subunit ribosomal protein L14|nr:50S ribosomal protein L14 [Bacillales bacterium]